MIKEPARFPLVRSQESQTYLSTPAQSVCADECPGVLGRVPCQKVDFQKLLPGTSNLPGMFAMIVFGGGLGVWGENPVLDPLLAGKLRNAKALTTLDGIRARFLQRVQLFY